MPPREWLTLTVTLATADRPRLDALLDDWGTLGLVETEPEAGREEVTAHFPMTQSGPATLEARCREAFATPPFGSPLAWRVNVIPDQDWTLPAREFFQGVRVGERLSILPAWAPDDHPLADAPVALRIDPGMAFGTGSHESTRLALGWLLDSLLPGQSVLDLGAGSAILAIAAAKLGASPVVAVEIDPDAEENARRNLALNAVSGRVDYHIADFLTAPLEPADVVVCNTLIELFEPHLPRLGHLARPGGALILAGLLVADEAALVSSLRACGLTDFRLRREGEWSSARVSI